MITAINGNTSTVSTVLTYLGFLPSTASPARDSMGVTTGSDGLLDGYYLSSSKPRRIKMIAYWKYVKTQLPPAPKTYYLYDDNGQLVSVYDPYYFLIVSFGYSPESIGYQDFDSSYFFTGADLTIEKYRIYCPKPALPTGNFYYLDPPSPISATVAKSGYRLDDSYGYQVTENHFFGFKKIPNQKALKDKNKPCYRHLITGYELDNRIFPTQLILLSSINKKIKLGFYRRNKLEPILDLISIDWVSFELSLIANLPEIIDITDIVLGTLYISQLISVQSNGTIPYDSLLETGLVNLFIYWNNLYTADNLSNLPYVSENKQIHLITANNDIWNNNPTIENDINFDINHPLFNLDNQRGYDWHIKPQSDGSYGDLIMDSPILREIHAALEAAKYKAEVPAVIGTGTVDNPQIPAIRTLGYSIANGGGQKLNDIHAALEAAKYKAEVPAVIGTGTVDNPQIPAIRTLGYSIANGGGQKLTEIHKALDAAKYSKVEGSNIPRVATLGHLISKISAILGYRPEPDGSFTEDTEKKLVRKIVPSTEKIDKKKIGVNNFGSDGMLLRRLNNRFNGDKIANDECVIVKDLPQLLAEYQDQINLALGLQESSAVEIRNNSEVSRYSNQLAMLSELLNLASSNHDMIRAALISSLIAQGQTSETIAALGLPTVTKTLPIDVDGKITHLPYKGVAPHRSISQEVATCTQNVGIVLGQLL